jgi:hypothetical protein
MPSLSAIEDTLSSAGIASATALYIGRQRFTEHPFVLAAPGLNPQLPIHATLSNDNRAAPALHRSFGS